MKGGSLSAIYFPILIDIILEESREVREVVCKI